MDSAAKYTFKMLAADTFTYALEITDMEWTWDAPEEVARGARRVFQSVFGDAIVCYMERQKLKPGLLKLDHDIILETYEDIKDYADEVIHDVLKADCFLMDVIRVFAFFISLVTKFYLDEDIHLIELSLNCLDEFYKDYLKRPLAIVGGYFALFRFAGQYVEYYNNNSVKLVDSTIVRAATTDLESSTMVVDKENSFTMNAATDISDLELEHSKGQRTYTNVKSKSCTPTKSEEGIRSILKMALKNEFSSPHSEHCPTEFCKTSELNNSKTKSSKNQDLKNSETKRFKNQDSNNSETKRSKTNHLKRRLSFSD